MSYLLKIRFPFIGTELLCILITLGLAGCSRSSSKIEQVLIERARAQAKYIRNPRTKAELDTLARGDSNALMIVPGKYASALQKIDVRHCPDDFQSAWMMYLKAWQNTDNEKKSINLTLLSDEDPESRTWQELKRHFHGAALVGDDF